MWFPSHTHSWVTFSHTDHTTTNIVGCLICCKLFLELKESVGYFTGTESSSTHSSCNKRPKTNIVMLLSSSSCYCLKMGMREHWEVAKENQGPRTYTWRQHSLIGSNRGAGPPWHLVCFFFVNAHIKWKKESWATTWCAQPHDQCQNVRDCLS